MNPAHEPQFRLLWKGRESGPFSLAAIREMLGAGEISRMHQVDFHGRWLVLDEFLAKHAGGHPPEPAHTFPPAPAEPGAHTSRLALAALALSLANFVPYLDFVTWLPALVCGHLALVRMERDPLLTGRWMAVTGLVITYFLLVMGLTFVVLMLAHHQPIF